MSSPYRLLFDHVLTRTDPERAHRAAFRAIRQAVPSSPAAPSPVAPCTPSG